MAVNTRNNRASALHSFRPGVWIFPDPDNDLDNAPDRRQMGHTYAREVNDSAIVGCISVQSASITVPEATATMSI